MFERFSGEARSAVAQAQEHARRLGHRYIGCEHLLLAAASTAEPASAAPREHGVPPAGVETEIVRLVGLGRAANLFSASDREALASIGIDLDVVRARIEATFGPDAFTRGGPDACRSRPAVRKNPVALLRRARRSGHHQHPAPSGHIPFTPRAKKSLLLSLREAEARHENYIGIEHLTLALVGMKDGAVPPILSALGAPQATLRAAILDRYRKAS